MKHDWQNIDSHGTIGWHRCSICGDRHHFPKNEVIEPAWLDTCEQRQAGVIKTLADKVTSLLHQGDADTETIRKLLAEAIVQHKVDSPYRTRETDHDRATT